MYLYLPNKIKLLITKNITARNLLLNLNYRKTLTNTLKKPK